MNILLEKLNDNKFKICGLITIIPVLLIFKKNYLSGIRYLSSQRLNGKIAIITGCNTGIGKETALDLAQRGASVIMACRDLPKSQIACEKIRKKSKNSNVFVEYLDLESFESVRAFAIKILNEYKSIDILVNNAGVMGCPYFKTNDGFEKHFQVNYLSHYLLTRLLMDRIKSTPDSRIVNLTSKLYETASVNWDELNMTSNYESVNCYKQSKLCNIMFTNELNRVLNLSHNDIKVNVYSVSPGIVFTNLGRYFFQQFSLFKKIAYIIFYPIVWYLMKTPVQGKETVVYCCIEPSIADKSGGFYRDCKEQQLLVFANNSENDKRLWDLSEKLIEKWL